MHADSSNSYWAKCLCLFLLLQVRTDRSFEYYEGDDNLNVNIMRDILLTYSFYNFDLGYCQVLSYKLAVSILLVSILFWVSPLSVYAGMLDSHLFWLLHWIFPLWFNWQMFLWFLLGREWVIICLLSCSWWRMNQKPFGVLWHWWNALDPTLTVIRMGCILSSLHSQRFIILAPPLHFVCLPFYQH